MRDNFLTFSRVVIVEERIESQVKKGKLPCVFGASGGGNKPYSNFQKKKDGEANAIMGG